MNNENSNDKIFNNEVNNQAPVEIIPNNINNEVNNQAPVEIIPTSNNNLNQTMDSSNEVDINAAKPVVNIESTAVKDENQKMVSQGFENLNNNFYEKEKKVWPIILIIILLAIVGFGCYYYFVMTNPLNLIKKTLDNVYDSAEDLIKETNISDIKTASGNANVIFTSNHESLKDMNGLNANIEYGYDFTNNNRNYFGLELLLDKEKLTDIKASLMEDKVYLDFKDIIGKVIYSELGDDEEINISEFVNFSKLSEISDDELYILKNIKDSIINNISKEKLSKKILMKDTGSKKTIANEIKYVIDYPEYKKIYKGIFDGIISDSKAVSIISKFSNTSESEVKNYLNQIKDNVSELDLSKDINMTITIDAFTNNLIELVISNGETELILTEKGNEANLEITLSDVGSISLTIDERENKAFMDFKFMDTYRFSLTSKIENEKENEATGNVTFILYDFGDINKEMATLTIDFNSAFNKDIKTMDIIGAVNADELSESDQQKIINYLGPIIGMLSPEAVEE